MNNKLDHFCYGFDRFLFNTKKWAEWIDDRLIFLEMNKNHTIWDDLNTSCYFENTWGKEEQK